MNKQIRTLRNLDMIEAVSDLVAKSILQKRLKRRHVPQSARETGKESSLGERVKTIVTVD